MKHAIDQYTNTHHNVDTPRIHTSNMCNNNRITNHTHVCQMANAYPTTWNERVCHISMAQCDSYNPRTQCHTQHHTNIHTYMVHDVHVCMCCARPAGGCVMWCAWICVDMVCWWCMHQTWTMHAVHHHVSHMMTHACVTRTIQHTHVYNTLHGTHHQHAATHCWQSQWYICTHQQTQQCARNNWWIMNIDTHTDAHVHTLCVHIYGTYACNIVCVHTPPPMSCHNVTHHCAWMRNNINVIHVNHNNSMHTQWHMCTLHAHMCCTQLCMVDYMVLRDVLHMWVAMNVAHTS